MAFRTIPTPMFWSKFSKFILSNAGRHRNSAVPPPGTIPSSTAQYVAHSASSNRSLISPTSTSLAPPTLIMATPPVSFAMRSLSLSRWYSLVSNHNAFFKESLWLATTQSDELPSNMVV